MPKGTLSERVNQLFKKERWEQARALLLAELEKTPDSHWLLERLSTTCYEQKKYRDALDVIEQARELAPDCPLVLWDYAGTLDALGETKQAIAVYLGLISRHEEALAGDEHWEGRKWGVSLLIDCLYRVGLCYQCSREFRLAQAALRDYLYLSQLPGVYQGIYTAADAEKHLRQLFKARGGAKMVREILDEAVQELAQTP